MFYPWGTKKAADPSMGWSVYLLPFLEQQSVYDMFEFTYPKYYASPGQNVAANRTLISAYLCPSDPAYGEMISSTSEVPGSNDSAMTNVCGVADSVEFRVPSSSWEPRQFPEADGILAASEPCRIADIKDGTSNTLIAGEVTAAGKGTNTGHFWSEHNILDTFEGINGPNTIPGGLAPASYSLFDTGFGSFHPGGCNFAMADGSVSFLSQNVSHPIMAALTTRDGPSNKNKTLYPTQVVSPEPAVSGPP
jgi:prepilin-type processing-associated H-X9-DG protein